MLCCINWSSWIAQLWRWRHSYHLTCQSLFTCWHSLTSLKTLRLISSLFVPCSLLPGRIVGIVVVVAVVEVFNAQALWKNIIHLLASYITSHFTIGRVCSFGCDFESLWSNLYTWHTLWMDKSSTSINDPLNNCSCWVVRKSLHLLLENQELYFCSLQYC